ncbi:MAG: T9SS type A sorting domain-containing protein, partial [Chitinophagales bacterium]
VDYEEEKEGEVLQYPLRTYIESLGFCYPPKPLGGNQLSHVFHKPSTNKPYYSYVYQPYNVESFDAPTNWESLQDTIDFYTNAQLDENWEVHSENFKNPDFAFSHLVITCTSTDFEEIVAEVMDSTKTFGVQAFEGENPVDSDFDQIEIKLSKQFGLLKWVSFDEWFFNDLKTHITIAGFEDAEGNIKGERSPLVADFFPYKIGDILTWEVIGGGSNIYQEEITDVERTDSTVRVTFNSSAAGDNQQKVLPYFPQYIVDLAHWRMGMGTIYDYEEESDDGSIPYRYLELRRMQDEGCGVSYTLGIEEKGCSYIIEEFGCGILCITADCYVCRDKYFSTTLGLTAVHVQSFGSQNLNLIEATVGDCYFTNIEPPTHFAEQITLHPNPTNNRFRLQLQNPKIKDLQLTITDIHGRTLQQMPILQSSIEVDLSEQTAGIYLVQISDGQSWWTEKVVKF